MENKLKTESAENRGLQIKKKKLVKMILEFNKDTSNEVVTGLL